MTKKEFENLQSGQIIQHKKNNEWVFIVHQNFSNRLVAVRTIEIRNPEDWETLTPRPQIEDQIAIGHAQVLLGEALRNFDWYQCIGRNTNQLIVYRSKKSNVKPYESFMGIPVIYKHIGKFKPA